MRVLQLFLIVQRYGIRKLEAILCGILLIISTSFVVELFLSKPSGIRIVKGLVPTLPGNSMFVAVAIIGVCQCINSLTKHPRSTNERARACVCVCVCALVHAYTHF